MPENKKKLLTAHFQVRIDKYEECLSLFSYIEKDTIYDNLSHALNNNGSSSAIKTWSIKSQKITSSLVTKPVAQ